jgi:hypothetical protein
MAAKQGRIFIKATIFVLIIGLLFFLSRYRAQPFGVMGSAGQG